MSASEEIKKERSITKGLFTRASNSVRQCIDARDDTDIIIKKLDDLDKRYANLLEKHELYKAEIQDNPDYNEAKEEEWMNGIEKDYLSSERLAHSYRNKNCIEGDKGLRNCKQTHYIYDE